MKTKTSILKLFYLFFIVTLIIIGAVTLANIVHEQYHVWQLRQYNITPSEICWYGVTDYKTEQQVMGGWVRHVSIGKKISEFGPYVVTYIIAGLGILISSYVCKLVFQDLKGGNDEKQNTTVRETGNGQEEESSA